MDLVLLDLRLPDGSGRKIGETIIGTAMVVLLGELNRQTAQEALAAGAADYIPKTEPCEIITSALGLVLASGIHVQPMALQATFSTVPPATGVRNGLGITCRSGLARASLLRKLNLAKNIVFQYAI